MKIAVAGAGYVGLSNAVLLAGNNEVNILDIDEWKVNLINDKKSPILDEEIEDYLKHKKLNLLATMDKSIYKDANYVIIATPTNYDSEKNYFDTSSVESVISDVLEINLDAVMIIKSTVPVGYTKEVKEK
ncbi:MAG: UDP-glucose 6-dehydrogenase, partial [Tissierella sp.]